MAEQFDMNIYNIALKNGSYTPPKNDASQTPTPSFQCVGDSAPKQNLTSLLESYHPKNGK